ncbi:hypothetical protein [Flavobacterium sp.]|uniref:hypothetical protein n=1 Tax=Flavobacterium sp. TaxID=239 RepID=UPI0035AFA47F
MKNQSTGFKVLQYLIIAFCVLSFSNMFSQIDESKQKNEKKHHGTLISISKYDDYDAEMKVLKNKTDSITFLYDSQNIAKLISIKNKKSGISNSDFHKYAAENNPKFRFESKMENNKSIVYFNKEKTLANIKIFEDDKKEKLIEIVFLSGLKMIDKILPQLKF